MKNIIFFLLISSTGFAAENSVSMDVKSDSSAANRTDKNSSLTVALTATENIPQLGLGMGFYIDPSMQVLLDVSRGNEYENKNSNVFGNTYKLRKEKDLDQVSLSLKNFFGNSFYTKAGLGYRRVSSSTIKGNSAFDASYGFTGNSTAGLIAIGNQWQFSSYTIGCDWISAWLPFSSYIDSEKINDPSSNGRYEATLRNDLTGDQDMYLRKPGIMISFYMGTSF